MKNINVFEKKYFEELDMILPIVQRVHGVHHEEIYEVAKIYQKIKDKINDKDTNLSDNFLKLREVTDNYKVPNDVCETYEKVYKMLESLDKKFQ